MIVSNPAPHGSVIWAVMPTRGGALPKASLEVLEEARRLASPAGARILAVLVDYGGGTTEAAVQCGRMGAHSLAVLACETPAPPSALAAELTRRLTSDLPLLVLFAGTARSVDLACRVAASTGLTMIDRCVQVDLEEGPVARATRTSAGGTRHAIHRWSDGPFLAALMPDAVGVGDEEPERVDIPVESWSVPLSDGPEAVRWLTIGTARDQEIDECDVLVSVGRGIGSEEAISRALELAEVLGAGLSGSRPVIEAGWLPYAKQVGQTGRSVSPRLYLALGISGATQHLAGIQRVECVVAVNVDGSAPLLARADLAVVGDLHEIVPALTRELSRRRSVMAESSRPAS